MSARVPQLRSVMTPFPHSVEIDSPVGEAVAMMRAHDVRHLPVTDGDELLGVVSDRELALVRAGAGADESVRVRDVCKLEVYSVDLFTSLAAVVSEMAERRLDAAVVLREGRLAGIFTITDACRVLGELLERLDPHDGGHEAA